MDIIFAWTKHDMQIGDFLSADSEFEISKTSTVLYILGNVKSKKQNSNGLQ